MAGHPRRRALIAELERRTKAVFDGDETKTHLDYLCDWLESGRTALALTHDLNKALKWEAEPMSHGSIQRYFKGLSDAAEAKIKSARADGAYAILDSTADIADEAIDSNEQAARARNRIASRQHLAEKFNREAFGQRGNALNVNVSVAGLHLDALRVRVAVAPAAAGALESDRVAELEPSAIAGAIASEAEVVSIEPAST